ncbi:MAG: hypothetical protein H7126_06450 [Candidatus Parcubacteria bacterium]|uniref:hypothetical protein n=1 Tax=Phormidesmis priestleyi TaxID=268141 RepID=UPI0012E81093|nr:hypothetical protein [Phormidesmis priestleyi]MBC7823506.1 hypothetical protein [Leptolyngbyaceae cyanobacterium LF-bin-113]
MPVVFDQVIGEVVPPVPLTQDEPDNSPPVAFVDRGLQTTLRHLEKRRARLKAD